MRKRPRSPSGWSAALHASGEARRCPPGDTARRSGPALTQHKWPHGAGGAVTAGGGAAEGTELAGPQTCRTGPAPQSGSARLGAAAPTGRHRTGPAALPAARGPQGRAGPGPAARRPRAPCQRGGGRDPALSAAPPLRPDRTWHKHDEDRALLLGGGDGGRDGAPEPHHGDRRAPKPRQPHCACAATVAPPRQPPVTRLRRRPEPRLLIGARGHRVPSLGRALDGGRFTSACGGDGRHVGLFALCLRAVCTALFGGASGSRGLWSTATLWLPKGKGACAHVVCGEGLCGQGRHSSLGKARGAWREADRKWCSVEKKRTWLARGLQAHCEKMSAAEPWGSTAQGRALESTILYNSYTTSNKKEFRWSIPRGGPTDVRIGNFCEGVLFVQPVRVTYGHQQKVFLLHSQIATV